MLEKILAAIFDFYSSEKLERERERERERKIFTKRSQKEGEGRGWGNEYHSFEKQKDSD